MYVVQYRRQLGSAVPCQVRNQSGNCPLVLTFYMILYVTNQLFFLFFFFKSVTPDGFFQHEQERHPCLQTHVWQTNRKQICDASLLCDIAWPPADKINTGWISSRSQSIVQWSRIEVTSLDAEILALEPTARLRNPLTSPCSCSAYSLTVWSSCRVPRRIRGIIWSVHLCSLFIWPKMILGVRLQNRRSQSSAGCVHTWFIWFTSRRDDLNFFHFEIQF